MRKYIILRAATTTELQDKMNAISETYKPLGSVVIDNMTKCYIQTMEEF